MQNVTNPNLFLAPIPISSYTPNPTHTHTPPTPGVITDEYKGGLERLRTRLAISPEGSRRLVALASRLRLGPVVRDLIDVWKSDIDGSARERKKQNGPTDKSRDPISSMDNVLGYMETGAQKEGGGPNVFMRECLNLVDFFAGNSVNAEGALVPSSIQGGAFFGLFLLFVFLSLLLFLYALSDLRLYIPLSNIPYLNIPLSIYTHIPLPH